MSPPLGDGDPLIGELVGLITDKLKQYETEGRAAFRRRIFTLLLPGSDGLDMWTDGYERATKVTELMADRQRYVPLGTEAVFEKLFIDCLTTWYWTKKPDGQGLNPTVDNFVKNAVKAFVAAIGDAPAQPAGGG